MRSTGFRLSWLLGSLLSSLLAPSAAWAWGERGHDAVARVAARILMADEDPEVAAWGRLLSSREHMLAHLSNVPDIVWRRPEQKLDALNPPSHYVDLEFILPDGKLSETQDFPQSIEEHRKRIEANCQKKLGPCAPGKTPGERLQKTGHAPFRIQGLMATATEALKEVKNAEGEAKTKAMSQALLHLGVLAHFVGDLANPHHTTADYDGWFTGQGGLHAYFESDMVDIQNLALEQEVFIEARRHKPAANLAKAGEEQALPMAWQLLRSSHVQLSTLTQLDKQVSLLAKSDGDGKKTEGGSKRGKKAERRPPAEVAPAYRDLIVLRLAMGADALARFWKLAWVQAQKPDVSFYRSYDYPVQPEFIPLGYEVN